MISDNLHFKPSQKVIFQKLGENLVLIHTQSNKIFDLNETGARLWELLSNGDSIDEARVKLLDEFEVSTPELNYEIHQTLDLFLKESLLVHL
jgi:hypothetical protein